MILNSLHKHNHLNIRRPLNPRFLASVLNSLPGELSRMLTGLALSTALALGVVASISTVPGISKSVFAAELLDINSADVEAIATTLNGIGPTKAQAIVDYRQQFGTFTQLDELTNVPGIGDATLEQIKALITIGDMPASQ